MGAVLIGRIALAAGVLVQAGSEARAEAPPPTEPKRFQATLERPLFSPTRRSPPAPVVMPPPMAPVIATPPPPPPSVTLSGVIIGGKGGVALLQRNQDPAAIRVAVGGDVDGWTVAEIHPRAVVLRRENQTATIELPTPPR